MNLKDLAEYTIERNVPEEDGYILAKGFLILHEALERIESNDDNGDKEIADEALQKAEDLLK